MKAGDRTVGSLEIDVKHSEPSSQTKKIKKQKRTAKKRIRLIFGSRCVGLAHLHLNNKSSIDESTRLF